MNLRAPMSDTTGMVEAVEALIARTPQLPPVPPMMVPAMLPQVAPTDRALLMLAIKHWDQVRRTGKKAQADRMLSAILESLRELD